MAHLPDIDSFFQVLWHGRDSQGAQSRDIARSTVSSSLFLRRKVTAVALWLAITPGNQPAVGGLNHVLLIAGRTVRIWVQDVREQSAQFFRNSSMPRWALPLPPAAARYFSINAQRSLDTFAEALHVCADARNARRRAEMGSRSPYGADDMAGNVLEWCWHSRDYYSVSPWKNPKGRSGRCTEYYAEACSSQRRST